MMNGLQTIKQWRGYFGSPSPSVLGTMNAVYPIGKIMGLIPTTYLADKYGRKVPMWIGFFLLLIGAALQGASTSLPMFIVSRWLLGAATAFIAQPAPILVTELAYPTQRGKISSLYNTFFVSLPSYLDLCQTSCKRLELTPAIVLRSNLSGLVNLWHIPTDLNLELEDSVYLAGSSSCDPVRLLLLRA